MSKIVLPYVINANATDFPLKTYPVDLIQWTTGHNVEGFLILLPYKF